jgi:hypothetical protein
MEKIENVVEKPTAVQKKEKPEQEGKPTGDAQVI